MSNHCTPETNTILNINCNWKKRKWTIKETYKMKCMLMCLGITMNDWNADIVVLIVSNSKKHIVSKQWSS